MFVDEVLLDLKAGDGGDGCMAFRREKYVEMGGPFGGNGGRGSDIIFEADEGLNTLLDLRLRKHIKGKKGANGEGKGKHGRNSENIIVKVPVGTVITDTETGFIIADLTKNKEQAVVASGGRGGRGNIAFATRTNPAPSFAENGEPGEEKRVKVELKLLADVGLVGMPSVGKSTFISKVSASKPKIAAYHFTTLRPNLGVVQTKDKRSFVIADLPGLIKGASLGEGLGDKFLRHIERTIFGLKLSFFLFRGLLKHTNNATMGNINIIPQTISNALSETPKSLTKYTISILNTVKRNDKTMLSRNILFTKTYFMDVFPALIGS